MNDEPPSRQQQKGLANMSRGAPHEIVEISDDDDVEEISYVAHEVGKRLRQSLTMSPAASSTGQIRPPDARPSPAADSQLDEQWHGYGLENYVYLADEELDTIDVTKVDDGIGDWDQNFWNEWQSLQPVESGPSNAQQPRNGEGAMELKARCLEKVSEIFPGICSEYLASLYIEISQTIEGLIAHIVELMEKGTQYPKDQDTLKTRKRKREVDEDEEAVKRYDANDRIIPDAIGGVRPYIRRLLSAEFPRIPMSFLDEILSKLGYRLYSACRVLDEIHESEEYMPYKKMQHARKIKIRNDDAFVENTSKIEVNDPQTTDILQELQLFRKSQRKSKQKTETKKSIESKEAENVKKAKREGTMVECGCCFEDIPLNRTIHCNRGMHIFCFTCARQNAEAEIENSKFELHCMSLDGCLGGFTSLERKKFLDESTMLALERNEQEAVLRMAAIENLARCPFCPYAAEYPPVNMDKEFRCQAPDCQIVSCRLCNQVSHLPRSCKEAANEKGLCFRREVEEAMSAAVIRNCNKCGTPFMKDEGCNKMTCTRAGCFNVQCYVCSKNCEYNHFNDVARGGKEGSCPLFESTEQRHENEVRAAEKLILESIRAEHPEYTEEDLKIKLSEQVRKDDEKRAAKAKLTAPLHRALPAQLQARRLIVGVAPGANYVYGPSRIPYVPTIVQYQRGMQGLFPPQYEPSAQVPILPLQFQNPQFLPQNFPMQYNNHQHSLAQRYQALQLQAQNSQFQHLQAQHPPTQHVLPRHIQGQNVQYFNNANVFPSEAPRPLPGPAHINDGGKFYAVIADRPFEHVANNLMLNNYAKPAAPVFNQGLGLSEHERRDRVTLKLPPFHGAAGERVTADKLAASRVPEGRAAAVVHARVSREGQMKVGDFWDEVSSQVEREIRKKCLNDDGTAKEAENRAAYPNAQMDMNDSSAAPALSVDPQFLLLRSNTPHSNLEAVASLPKMPRESLPQPVNQALRENREQPREVLRKNELSKTSYASIDSCKTGTDREGKAPRGAGTREKDSRPERNCR